MKASAVVSGVCVVPKSVSVFPVLMPCSIEVVSPLQRRAKLALAKFGASCKVVLASLPQSDCFVFAAMILLAID